MKNRLYNRKTFSMAMKVIPSLLIIAMICTRCIKIPTNEITITLSVSTNSLNFTSSGEQQTFSIYSNDKWIVRSESSWLTVSSSSGSNNETVTVTAVANTNTASRTATITVKSLVSGVAEQTITVTQAALIPTSLTVSTKSLSFDAAGEQTTITITSNTSWTITCSESWLTVSPVSGTNNRTVSVMAATNAADTSRTATIIVNGGGLKETINVSQAALTPTPPPPPTPTLTVSTNSLSFVVAGGQMSFIITSNTSWTISKTTSPWLTITPVSGSNNRTVSVTATPNATTSPRTATLTVSGGGLTQSIHVTQVAKTDAFDYEHEMVEVKGGTFTMGCTSEQGGYCRDNEKPSHLVTVSDFYIGKFEVTNAQWRAVMGYSASLYYKGDNYPVEFVSWENVQEFIRELNALTGKKYRLPTEAEWEYAARGGKSEGYMYSGSNTVGNVAWYLSNSGAGKQPVGTKAPNALGIYDMSGNVWEWCSDWFGDYNSNAQQDPTGPVSGTYRVYRGGSWGNAAEYMRVSIRFPETPDSHSAYIGFRLACSP